jgi:hypothetical protein
MCVSICVCRYIIDSALSTQYGVAGYVCNTEDCNSAPPPNCTSAEPSLNMTCYQSYGYWYGYYNDPVTIPVGDVCVAYCSNGETYYSHTDVLAALSIADPSYSFNYGIGAYMCSTPNCNSASLDCTMLTCYVGSGSYYYSYTVPYGYECMSYCSDGIPYYSYVESRYAGNLTEYYGAGAYACSTPNCNSAPPSECAPLSCYMGSGSYYYSYTVPHGYECIAYCYYGIPYYSYLDASYAANITEYYGAGAYACSTPNCNSAPPSECGPLSCYIGSGSSYYSYTVPYGYECVAYCYYGIPRYDYVEASYAAYFLEYYGAGGYACSTPNCNSAPPSNCTSLSCYVGYDDVVSSYDVYNYNKCVSYCYNDVAYYSYVSDPRYIYGLSVVYI